MKTNRLNEREQDTQVPNKRQIANMCRPGSLQEPPWNLGGKSYNLSSTASSVMILFLPGQPPRFARSPRRPASTASSPSSALLPRRCHISATFSPRFSPIVMATRYEGLRSACHVTGPCLLSLSLYSCEEICMLGSQTHSHTKYEDLLSLVLAVTSRCHVIDVNHAFFLDGSAELLCM